MRNVINVPISCNFFIENKYCCCTQSYNIEILREVMFEHGIRAHDYERIGFESYPHIIKKKLKN